MNAEEQRGFALLLIVALMVLSAAFAQFVFVLLGLCALLAIAGSMGRGCLISAFAVVAPAGAAVTYGLAGRDANRCFNTTTNYKRRAALAPSYMNHFLAWALLLGVIVVLVWILLRKSP